MSCEPVGVRVACGAASNRLAQNDAQLRRLGVRRRSASGSRSTVRSGKGDDGGHAAPETDVNTLMHDRHTGAVTEQATFKPPRLGRR
jgi:hypothetical protein